MNLDGIIADCDRVVCQFYGEFGSNAIKLRDFRYLNETLRYSDESWNLYFSSDYRFSLMRE